METFLKFHIGYQFIDGFVFNSMPILSTTEEEISDCPEERKKEGRKKERKKTEGKKGRREE